MKLRILLLLFANLIAIGILLYILDFVGVVNYYSRLEKNIMSTVNKKKYTRTEDPNLIEQAEVNKAIESLDLKLSDLNKKEETLKQKEQKLIALNKKINDEKKEIEKTKEKIKLQESQKVSYKNRIRDLAVKYANMPPEKSVERIVELKDDLLILDVLKEMDNVAKENGTSSIVPYLYSLMDKDVAARLLKKSTVQE